ncbi:hypothetical protein BDZ97DRAFT_1810473 [Flammula alnicola]|nr:hypothetical protein BDZ97DRAFT_1810473 [Flammula alnicola]
MSGLHFSLRNFEEVALPPKFRDRFLQYTRRIRQKWKTLIEKCPSTQLQGIHWALENDRDNIFVTCITYIDTNHAARASPEVFSKSLIYFLDDKLEAC